MGYTKKFDANGQPVTEGIGNIKRVNVDISGDAEVGEITITAAPTAIGNVTVTLDGVSTNIAVDPAVETTASAVATKIRGTAFSGWTTGGTGATVTFTANAIGPKQDTAYADGGTGATGTASTTVQGWDVLTDYSVVIPSGAYGIIVKNSPIDFEGQINTFDKIPLSAGDIFSPIIKGIESFKVTTTTTNTNPIVLVFIV